MSLNRIVCCSKFQFRVLKDERIVSSTRDLLMKNREIVFVKSFTGPLMKNRVDPLMKNREIVNWTF
jgi:hypothetical protein